MIGHENCYNHASLRSISAALLIHFDCVSNLHATISIFKDKNVAPSEKIKVPYYTHTLITPKVAVEEGRSTVLPLDFI